MKTIRGEDFAPDAKQQLFTLVDRIRQRNPDLDSDAVLDKLEALAGKRDER